MKRAAHRNPESGYALLFVYAMAATVAIMLFMELPRVAFEAQRDKEQLLIDRGEQYSRAINLYVRKFNRYPADFDALNNTQNQRFLRHKYIDPMTGKDDWRIIHVGPGGVFTDSLIYNKKKKDDDKDKPEQQNFITELQQTGGNQPDPNQQAVNLATRQRASDQPGAPGDPNNPNPAPQFDANGQPIPNNPAPAQVLPNGTIVPVQTGNQQPPVAGQFPPGMNGIPNPATGATFPPVSAPQQAGTPPTQNGFPFQQQPFGQQAGQQPPQTPNVPQAAAANLIGQLLTTPRPGGLNGLGAVPQATVDQNGNPIQGAATGGVSGAATTTTGTAATTAAPAAAQTIGGGIAGVASKDEQEGIKIYKDQKSYNKWEFVYDITKDPMRGGGATVPQPAGTQNGTAQNGATQTGAQNGLQPGASSATGTASPTTFAAPITSPSTQTTPPSQ